MALTLVKLSEHQKDKKTGLSPVLLVGILLALFFGIALYLRIFLPYDQIFSGDWIKFASTDAYYNMRLIDNLVQHFPHRIMIDPYISYPSTAGIDIIPPFFHWLLGGIIWVIGLGSPTQHTIDVVGVYFPAVLGALTVIPVYFIGKVLFGRWAGVIAAGLIAIMPGEFLGRSILGFTDYHVAEWLFTTTAMMFLILAIKTSRERQLTISHLWHRDWAIISKPIIYSLLAGIFLLMYFLSWTGALLFAFIISAYFIIQFIMDHLRRQSTDYLCPVGVILFLIVLIGYVPSAPTGIYTGLYPVSLGVALLIPVVLSSISRQMRSREIRPAYYPLSLIGLGLVGLAIFYTIAPSYFEKILSWFSMFNPSGPRTILEMQPFLFPGGEFSLSIAWGNFTTGFFLSLISLGILIYLVIKNGNAEKSLLVVWSLIILAATLGQRRFAYYLAVNVALLTGYLSWQILRLAGFKESGIKSAKTAEKVVSRLTTRHVRYINMALAAIVIFFFIFFPNISPATTIASQARFAPSDAWVSSLSWLKENTPEPFGDPDFYYQLYEPPPPEELYEHPESVYGVTAWGDYGYWIIRIAHRTPNRKPGPAGANIARFFVSQDEDSAQEIRKELNSAYIIIDDLTVTTKFWALARWAGLDESEFYGPYFIPQDDKLVPIRLFHPAYYRSLAVRLYNFDGKAVIPQESVVISYEERTIQGNKSIKVITDIQPFTSYEEATSYISSQESGRYQIAGNNPFVSPVPLDELKQYKLIHTSAESATQPEEKAFPSVKIFKYVE